MKKLVSFLALAGGLALVGCASDVGTAEESVQQFCGGIAGIACPEGYACVDDPSDSCDPDLGGADCGGVCRPDRGQAECRRDARNRRYVSRDPAQCAAIRFYCAGGEEAFFDECGCGCRDTGNDCNSIALCVMGYEWSDAACACVPTAPSPGGDSVACGPNTCRGGQVCCNASCGICTDPGGFCIQLACEPI